MPPIAVALTLTPHPDCQGAITSEYVPVSVPRDYALMHGYKYVFNKRSLAPNVPLVGKRHVTRKGVVSHLKLPAVIQASGEMLVYFTAFGA